MLRCTACFRFRLTSIRKFSDFYKILGVDRKADVKEIKKAFRKQSLECHPDKFPGDAAKEARFKTISEAYQTLSDASARRDYDAKLGGTSPRSGTPSQHGKYAAYTNNPNNFRQYRNPNQNPFERSEKWNEVFDELNKQRYNNFSKRRPDFSDFMNGRRGTDWDDYRRTFKEDAHPFNETKHKSNRFYESQRFQSYEKYTNFSKKWSNFLWKISSFFIKFCMPMQGLATKTPNKKRPEISRFSC